MERGTVHSSMQALTSPSHHLLFLHKNALESFSLSHHFLQGTGDSGREEGRAEGRDGGGGEARKERDAIGRNSPKCEKWSDHFAFAPREKQLTRKRKKGQCSS